MKKGWLILSLFVLTLFLVSCKETPPLPPGVPEAGTPIGSAIAGLLAGQSNWATNPTGGPFNFKVDRPENSIFNLRPDKKEELSFKIAAPADSYIFRYGWSCKGACDINNISTYPYFEFTDYDRANVYTSQWFKFETPGEVGGELEVDRANYRLGENYVAAYACKRLGWGRWDCNNDGVEDTSENGPKYLLQTFKLYPTCEDSDKTSTSREGIDYFVQGKVLGVDNTGKVIDDSDTCVSNTAVKEYFCVEGEPQFEYEILAAAQYSCDQTKSAVCLYGACTSLPETTKLTDFAAFVAHEKTRDQGGRLVVPAKVQLSTTQVVPLSIAVNHDLIYKQFFFGKDKNNGSLYTFRETPAKADWIMKNATAEISLSKQSTVAAQKAYLESSSLKMNLGTNVFAAYACTKESNVDRLNCELYSQNVNILPSCIDADLSNESNKGTTYGITEAGVTYVNGISDQCVNTAVHQSVVREYYCEAGTDGFIYIKNKNIECGANNICFNGKCETYEVPETA